VVRYVFHNIDHALSGGSRTSLLSEKLRDP
jgi:hypothetical protein